MNLRAGPGTVYPVVGHARKGQVLPVVARWGRWYQVAEGKWIYGGKGLAEPNAGAKAVQAAKKIPPTPTPRPTPTSKPTNPPSSNLPPMQDVVVLGPNTGYPVRARVFRGWGYEIVDKSAKWDVVMYRDVLGYVLHKATHPFNGAPIVDWNKYTDGVRFTLMDPYYGGHCPKSMPKMGCYSIPSDCSEAPILLNDWPTPPGWSGDCYNWLLPGKAGDGTGGAVTWGCSWIFHNPKECFFVVQHPGQYITDVVISGFRTMFDWYFDEYHDFSKPPYDAMGKATRNPKTGQWRWTNPFLKIVPAAP